MTKTYTFRTLKGRYVHASSLSKDAKRTFVLVYGQHASLERISSIVEALRRYGDVYAVDNPGFGGMDSAYKIKQKPTLEFYAEHLKHFIDTHIPKDRKLTMLGISYGFQMITQMLATHDDIAERTELTVSFVGFVKHDNLHIPFVYRHLLINFLGGIGYTRPGAKLLSAVIRPKVVHGIYKLSKPLNVKLKNMSRSEIREYADEQSLLWVINDHRTHSVTAFDFLKRNDLTKLKVNAKLLHLGVPNDHLLDNKQVSEQVAEIYRHADIYDLNLANHAPLDIDTPDKVVDLIPTGVRDILKSSENKTAVLE